MIDSPSQGRRQPSTRWIGFARTLAVLALCLTAFVGGPWAGVAAAQSAPNAYYGDAVSDAGVAAPEGTVIVAVLEDGTVADEITVQTAGEYGGSGGFDEKLRVESEEDHVSFHVGDADGPEAFETDNPEPESERLDLTFPVGTFSDATPTPTPTTTPTATATPSATATTTATATSTATASPTQTQVPTGTSTSTESTAGTATTTSAVADGTADSTERDSETVTEQAGFRVTNATLNRTEVDPGEPVRATATIENEMDEEATYRGVLALDGETVRNESYQIPPGESRTVSLRFRTNRTGEFTVTIGGNEVGRLTVGETDDGDGGGNPLFGLLRPLLLFVGLPIVIIYGSLKAVALYLGY